MGLTDLFEGQNVQDRWYKDSVGTVIKVRKRTAVIAFTGDSPIAGKRVWDVEHIRQFITPYP